MTRGIFGFKGRNGLKIQAKQIEVSGKIGKLLSNCMIAESKDKLTDLLSKMLDINYKTRLSPKGCLSHDYFKS